MSCTADQIAEKKRVAQERLRQRQQSTLLTNGKTKVVNDNNVAPAATEILRRNSALCTVTSPTSSTHNNSVTRPSSSFYGTSTTKKTAELQNYEAKMKSQQPYKNKNRILSQPYPSKDSKTAATNAKTEQKIAPVFQKTVTCSCAMISSTRFHVITEGYYAPLIDMFKTIPTRMYDAGTRIWSFHIKDYDLVQEKVSSLNPSVVIGGIPKFVRNLLKTPSEEIEYSCLHAIEPTVEAALLSFQKEGVCFGIQKQGRCMIADDMGLGKTYQALAIADFYKDDWPLLVCTTAATRDTWAEQVRKLLPWVPSQYIVTFNSTSDYFGDAKVLIVSYALMERNLDRLAEKKFSFIILDESHILKNFKSKSTTAALRLAEKAKRVVLLTGTPALSRPCELFTQLQMIDRTFFNFKEYSTRYCAGKQTTFGWDSTGQSNLQELNIILARKFMIRRTKEQVEFQLKEKSRETIILDKKYMENAEDVLIKEAVENMKVYSQDFMNLKGKQRDEVLLKFYSETARVKASAVCAYLKKFVRESDVKFIIFAHHQFMLNAISECLNKLKVDSVRIDGKTSNDQRTDNVKRFQGKERCRAAILSLKACSAGITLTAASMVIFAELDWNPSTLAQAEARAHRIGQLEDVTCRYLLAQGTADDIIWEMLKKKQSTLNKAGLFSEDLSDATHSFAEVSVSRTFKDYFEVLPKKSTASSDFAQPQASTSNDHADVVSVDLQNANDSKENEFADLLNDGDDDLFPEIQ